MAGPNQHFIPVFLQRGFGVRRSGKPKEIWKYEQGGAPRSDLIKKTASAPYFYSEHLPDGSSPLDDKISDTETPLARQVDALRILAAGSPVASDVAAEIVMLLAPRSSHMRSALTSGLERLAEVAAPIFTDPDALERMAGLDQEEPNDRFRDKISDVLAEIPQVQASGLPTELLQRVAFYLAKERFDQSIASSIPAFKALFEHWGENAAQVARDGHNRALERMQEKGERYQALASMHWSVEDGPQAGAILPDSVAIAQGMVGGLTSLLMAEGIPQLVLLPLSTKKILVARRSADVAFEVEAFNEAAAAASHEFFLAHEDTEGFATLAGLIGIQSTAGFDEAINDAIAVQSEAAPQSPAEATAPVDFSTFREGQPQRLNFILSYPPSLDRAAVDQFTQTVTGLVEGLAPYLPLARLDAIQFADNYAEALAGVDRGAPHLRPIQTIDSEIGVGLASAVTVIRGDAVKSHIVLQGELASLLISENDEDQRFALHTLTYQLARVAYVDLGERSLEGVMLSPVEHPLQSFLFRYVDPAIQAYHAGFFAAPFGDAEEVAARHRQLLLNALGRLTSVVDPARIAYRFHGIVDTLIASAMPEVEFVLQFAATLLGHCEGSGASIDAPDGSLRAALTERGLEYWLVVFGHDLERWRKRAGLWKSIDEFLMFGRHVERVMWTIGMFPWLGPNGVRIEIPVAKDAEVLLAIQQTQQASSDTGEA